MPICDVQYEIFTKNNIPDCVPQFHNFSPLVVNSGGTEKHLFCRTIHTPKPNTVQYIPFALPPDMEASKQVKRGYLGAVYKDKFEQLPNDYLKVVFETQLDQSESTPVVRPVKAKCYLLGELTLEPGKYYKVA